MTFEPHASAYRLKDRLIIHSDARTAPGYYVLAEPVLQLDVSASPREIGEVILSALAGSHDRVDVPADLQGLVKPLLKAAGVSSYRRLQQSAVYCSICWMPEEIQIIPTHNGGTKGDSQGFIHQMQHRVCISVDSAAEEIGVALVLGFSYCTSIY